MVCSKFWKLDKIDKIVIALTFIVVSMFSLFSCFCFASESLDYDIVSNLTVDTTNRVFVYSPTSVAGYVLMEPGYIYTVNIPDSFTSSRGVYLSEDVPSLGVSFSFLSTVKPGNSYSYYNYSGSNFLYFDVVSANSGITFTREKIPGFEDTIMLLTSTVGLGSFWSVFENSLPYVLIVVVVAFGIYLITRMIKRLSKGKGRL